MFIVPCAHCEQPIYTYDYPAEDDAGARYHYECAERLRDKMRGDDDNEISGA